MACRERMGPLGTVRISGIPRDRLPIVLERDELDSPGFGLAIDDRVARMRTARLHIVEGRAGVVIGGQTDAARVDDAHAIYSSDARNVGVPAEYQPGFH